MKLQLLFTLTITSFILTYLSSCGEGEKSVSEPVQEKQEEPASLVNETEFGNASLVEAEPIAQIEPVVEAEAEDNKPEPSDAEFLALETAPKSMEDFESSVRDVALEMEPKAAASQLRQAAAFLGSQPAAGNGGEQSRWTTVETHLRAIASKMDAVDNPEDMEKVFGQLQAMMEMYMP